MENGEEIKNLECQYSLQVCFIKIRSKRFLKMQFIFSGNPGGQMGQGPFHH